jgi:hypothetical protein
MVEKICKCCGKPFIAETNRKRLCDSCKEHNRKEHATTYMKKYTEEKRHAVNIAEEDYTFLKKMAKISNMSVAKVIHIMIKEYE